jgi:hypothetical protein
MAANKATRREREQRDRRLAAISEALADERRRFNEAVARVALATLRTAFGPYVVKFVNADHWYACYPVGGRPDDHFSGRSFAGCNDGAWEDLLR